MNTSINMMTVIVYKKIIIIQLNCFRSILAPALASIMTYVVEYMSDLKTEHGKF